MRNAIREDLREFAVPAFLVYSAGAAVSGWDLIRQQEGPFTLSVQSFVGLALVITGLAISLVSAGTLGRAYSSSLTIREDHRLITRGIYHYTRHPIYLGTIMVSIGMPVFALSLYGLLIMSFLIPLFLRRIRMEERLLIHEFGDAYREYIESTSKLIPLIY